MYKSDPTETRDKVDAMAIRLRKREPGALSDLYDIYGRILYALIVRLVSNPNAAEDLVQETFLRAWNRANQLNEDNPAVGPWLIAIARRCTQDYLRSLESRRDSSGRINDRQLGSIKADHNLSASSYEWLTVAAFNGLSDDQRCLIELAVGKSIPRSTVTDKLKRPVSVVSGYARSALSWLRRANGGPTEWVTRVS